MQTAAAAADDFQRFGQNGSATASFYSKLLGEGTGIPFCH
jgi:hypothetical protein